jgi:sialate O-acetylesterase
MRQRMFLLAAGVLLLGGALAPLRADVTPHSLFADNMVLQQGTKVPVWGTAADGEEVTVSFQGQTVKTTATEGKWLLTLDKLQKGGPFEMTIAGQNKVQLKNILVGEVWICSGQSNMEQSVKNAADPDKTIAASANPMIRLFTVKRVQADMPASELKDPIRWAECGPTTVPGFSAVAYHFGRHLEKDLKTPVGLIHTSWGGTPAEAWTKKQVLEADPLTKDLAGKSSKLYNSMIHPLIPYAIKGAIWYQGESNAGRAYQYRTLFPNMIKNWRDDWKQGDFPFLLVQLAPFKAIVAEPQESDWAELREAQLLATRNGKNVGMAVITDVGDEKDIHPKQKEPVGARLALAARAIAYHEKIEHAGPTYDSQRVDANKIILSFKHVGSGLVVKGEKLTGFTIAGEDRKFVNADAQILEDKVVVTSAKVDKPVAVRFGWANYPVVNLWNKEGLPATPFRTDDFPMITAPKKPAAGQ